MSEWLQRCGSVYQARQCEGKLGHTDSHYAPINGSSGIAWFESVTQSHMTAHARRDDPSTSHEAARSITVETATVQMKEILRYLAIRPRTDSSLIERLNVTYGRQWSDQSIRSRRKQLVDAGLVRDSGQRATLKSGRKSIIWELVP